MRFDVLRVNNVRNIKNINIEPSNKLNLIIGPNASGKTALLESIHLLARARSFRTPRIKEVIQREQSLLQVSAQIMNAREEVVFTGIEKAYGKTSIKYDGKALQTVSEQVKNIPLVTITPDSHTLVTGPPKQRRHWLDWAMFHVEPAYISLWRDYHTSLRNRNNLLKSGSGHSQLPGWEKSMASTASILNTQRQSFIQRLQDTLVDILAGSFPLRPEVLLSSGCPDKSSFSDYLAGDREQDRLLGYTKYGPHKADISFMCGEDAIAQVFSRGQVKRFVIALQVALARVLESINCERPVLLIDDYTAELDNRAQTDLLELLREYDGQIFLTATELDEKLRAVDSASLFHVEHGVFNKVIK